MPTIYKRLKFKKDLNEYFHLNFDFETHPLFPELDWLLLNYHLNRLAQVHDIELLGFVMMSSHCHLLFKSPLQKENYFTEALLRELNVKCGESSLVEPICNIAQFLNSYKYLYRNPVEAGMVRRCEDYRFSSLHGLLGKSELATQVIDPLSVAQNPIKILNWLNNHFEKKLFHFRTSEM